MTNFFKKLKKPIFGLFPQNVFPNNPALSYFIKVSSTIPKFNEIY